MMYRTIQSLTVEYKGKSAKIYVKKREKRTLYNGIGTEYIKFVHNSPDAGKILGEIARDSFSKVKQYTYSLNQNSGYIEGDIEIMANNFDFYFKSPEKKVVTGATAHFTINGQKIESSGDVEFITLNDVYNMDIPLGAPAQPQEPKCDCGAAAVNSTRHSDWCTLAKKGLPE